MEQTKFDYETKDKNIIKKIDDLMELLNTCLGKYKNILIVMNNNIYFDLLYPNEKIEEITLNPNMICEINLNEKKIEIFYINNTKVYIYFNDVIDSENILFNKMYHLNIIKKIHTTEDEINNFKKNNYFEFYTNPKSEYFYTPSEFIKLMSFIKNDESIENIKSVKKNKNVKNIELTSFGASLFRIIKLNYKKENNIDLFNNKLKSIQQINFNNKKIIEIKPCHCCRDN